MQDESSAHVETDCRGTPFLSVCTDPSAAVRTPEILCFLLITRTFFVPIMQFTKLFRINIIVTYAVLHFVHKCDIINIR